MTIKVKMKPGLELDKSTAQAMGWTQLKANERSGVVYWYGLRPGGTEAGVIPGYSIDGVAAWKAWEWLEKNNPWLRVSLQRDNEGNPTVYRHSPNGQRIEVASGETYAHAICLAILEATKK